MVLGLCGDVGIIRAAGWNTLHVHVRCTVAWRARGQSQQQQQQQRSPSRKARGRLDNRYQQPCNKNQYQTMCKAVRATSARPSRVLACFGTHAWQGDGSGHCQACSTRGQSCQVLGQTTDALQCGSYAVPRKEGRCLTSDYRPPPQLWLIRKCCVGVCGLRSLHATKPPAAAATSTHARVYICS